MSKKQAKKKSSKKGSKKKAQRQPRSTSGAYTGLAMGVCSVTNPFCPEAIGSRWPDNSHTKSIGWGFQNQLHSLTADGAGTGAALFLGSLQNTIYLATIGGTTATYNGSGLATVTPPSCSRYRITSWGLRLNSSLSKMTATGTCHIRLFSPETYSSYAAESITSTMADASWDIPISRLIDTDAFILPMPLGSDARLFYQIESAATLAFLANVKTTGWQGVQVGCTGAPVSSTPINVYLYYHFEIVPVDGDSANAFAHAPPPSNPAIQNANAGVLERVGNFVEGTAKKVDSLVQSSAMKYLAAGIGAWYGGPQGASTAYAITDRGQRMLTVD